MKYLIYDYETFFDSKAGLTLRKMSIPEYIGHKDFVPHCLGVEFEGERKIIWGDKDIQKYLDGWKKYDGEVCWVAHNAFFDLAINKWRYGYVPSFNLCTVLLANHVLGSAKETGKKNSLKELAERLGFQAKGRLDFADGVRTFDPSQLQLLTSYLHTDLQLGRKVLDALLPHVSNPEVELWLVDHTLKMYVDKPLDLNFDTMKRADRLIQERRDGALLRLSSVEGFEAPVPKLRERLSSNAQFEQDLKLVLDRYKVPFPHKTRPVNKNELKKFAKLKAAAYPADPDPDAVRPFHLFLKEMQGKGADVFEDGKGDITLGETKRVPALAKKDEDFIRLSFSPFEGVSALVNARLIERSAITSTARLLKMRKVAGGLGVMPVHLVYYGAHTGRWSGGGGFNFQNMSNPDREKDPGKKAIAACVRESFEAPDGFVFISADAAQIEARVNPWITGQWDVLAKFASGVDLYSDFISGVINEDIHKPKGDEPEPVQSHLKLMRHIGKEAVLALGYQMGVKKFILRLREDPEVARMFETGELTEEFCSSVVKAYREKNTSIVAGWGDLNNAFFVAAKGGIREVGPITFRRGTAVGSSLPVVRAVLPSGRYIYYRDIRQEQSKSPNAFNDGKEWKHGAGQKIYGGLLLENVTQAVSRDILVESLIRAELDRKLPIILHVHDSLVALSPEDKAEDNLKWMIESLKTSPEWAGKRLVLGAEGKISRTLVT